MKLRLDKYLADMGLGTRSQIKKDISKGQVLVNGTVSKDAGTRIDTEKDQVSYLGQAVTYAEYEYYMLNKPAGVVSATEDRHDRTVLDLIDTKQRKDLFPVGRLDKDTAGSWCSLILILFSVILTGCNLYSKIGRFGGAGSLVPITGFANSVASSAIEYKAEGQVFGIGCKIFTIAGPVILYGILSSWILGVIYYLFTMIP